jgi:predicted transcriptional regulator
MSDTVVSTVRLSKEMAAALSAVAQADEMPVSEAIREAIDRHIAIRRADQAFQERLKKCLDENREVLELLSGGATQ